MPDRQFEAVLQRLDRIAEELARLNRQAELGEGFQLMARELRNLNESLERARLRRARAEPARPARQVTVCYLATRATA